MSYLRNLLEQDGYKPRLSGHETFPLRYGWLKKAFDAVSTSRGHREALFLSDDAIAKFGVGKNMVAAIRHWAVAAGVLDDDLRSTALGELIFDDQGLDPWMEEPSTSWLAHWHIVGRPAKTTWYWAFNHFHGLTFERETLARGIADLAERRSWPRASISTIRRDVGCFVRAYAPAAALEYSLREDALESPLAELGLIRATGRRDGFRFVRGPKPTLRAGVFCFALSSFWQAYAAGANTLSFEAIALEPGSPGRVFVLGEDDLVELLGAIENVTDGVYRWSETAGLRQAIRGRPLTNDEMLRLVRASYPGRSA